ncbi:MAG: methyltransferase domain-containing protein [Bdellovibrionaceae bacterium]|nr:methyltransferase domain-containing protein [Pseudobdellovibrionaceae bacterium]
MNPGQFWNQIYQSTDVKNHNYQQFLRQTPTSLVAEHWENLKKGKTLDIGSGLGTDALFLSKKGFEVLGLDISETAKQRAEKNISSAEQKVEFKVADIELHLFGLLQYDTILMNYYRPHNNRLYQEIIKSLKFGGTLLIESYLVDEINEVLGKEDDYKNFYFKHNELLKNLTPLRILFYREASIQGKTRVQCIAQKPTDKDVEKYNLFNMADSPKEIKKSAQMELAESLFKKK